MWRYAETISSEFSAGILYTLVARIDMFLNQHLLSTRRVLLMLSNEFCQMLARNKIFSIWNDGKRSIRAGLKLSAFALVTPPHPSMSKVNFAIRHAKYCTYGASGCWAFHAASFRVLGVRGLKAQQ